MRGASLEIDRRRLCTWALVVLLIPMLMLAACAGRSGSPGTISAQSRGEERISDSMRAALASSPVLDASTSSHIQFAIRPLGLVPFDGQVLPRVSPDGRFIATQGGHAQSSRCIYAAFSPGSLNCRQSHSGPGQYIR